MKNSEKELMDEDVEFYRTHDQSVWNNYDPKRYGGKGFTGDESQLTAKKEPVTTPITNNKPAVSFGDEMRVKQLEREHEELKRKVENIEVSDFQKGAEQVKQTRDSLLIKYPYADVEAVNAQLGVFFRDNGRHPTGKEVENFVKRSNDFVAVQVANAKQGMIPKTTAMPSARGTSPLTPKKDLPALDDVDGWVKLAKEDMVGG